MGKLKIFLFFLIIAAISCNTTEPPQPETSLKLETEDVSSIEAWIKITTSNIQLPAEVTLKKNNAIEKTISLLTQDSVIYIDSSCQKQRTHSRHPSIQTYKHTKVTS